MKPYLFDSILPFLDCNCKRKCCFFIFRPENKTTRDKKKHILPKYKQYIKNDQAFFHICQCSQGRRMITHHEHHEDKKQALNHRNRSLYSNCSPHQSRWRKPTTYKVTSCDLKNLTTTARQIWSKAVFRAEANRASVVPANCTSPFQRDDERIAKS